MPTVSIYRSAALTRLTRQRRRTVDRRFANFLTLYLDTHATTRPSRMHRQVIEILQEATVSRQRKIAIAAPRGHAKTTLVSLAYVLWSALHGKESLILLLSATSEQAQQLLRDIRRELTENPLLQSDFPEVCAPLLAPRQTGVVIKQNRIELPNGVCIRVLGSQQALRGMKHRDQRPTLIVADDLENLEQVESEEQREKLRSWFYGTLLKAGQPSTNVVVIGTVLHHDSLLGRLTNKREATGGWRCERYKAVESFSVAEPMWQRWEDIRRGDELFEEASGDGAADAYFRANSVEMLRGTQVLWPERESYLDLMKMRLDEGEASFQAEKQNEPVDPETCLFARTRIRFWDAGGGVDGASHATPEEVHRALSPSVHFVMACDPSLGGQHGRGDYGAVILLARDDRSNGDEGIYVLHAMIERRKPNELIEYMVELARQYPIDETVIESNQFQAVMADDLQKRLQGIGAYSSIEKLNNRSNKRARILGLEPIINSGRLRFCSQDTRLLAQLREFPLGKYDDGPDALEMAVNAAKEPMSYAREFSL